MREKGTVFLYISVPKINQSPFFRPTADGGDRQKSAQAVIDDLQNLGRLTPSEKVRLSTYALDLQ